MTGSLLCMKGLSRMTQIATLLLLLQAHGLVVFNFSIHRRPLPKPAMLERNTFGELVNLTSTKQTYSPNVLT